MAQKSAERPKKGKHPLKRIWEKLNGLKLHTKMRLIQVFCILLPLFATDTMLLRTVIKAEENMNEELIESIADSVSYTVLRTVESARSLMQAVHTNWYVNEFLETDFEDYTDYYRHYVNLMKNPLYQTSVGSIANRLVIYTDNPTIMSGSFFRRVSDIVDTPWYKAFQETDGDYMVYVDYVSNWLRQNREISIFLAMDYYHEGSGGNFLRMDLDYTSMQRDILAARYPTDVYVCENIRVLLSNTAKGGANAPFEILDPALRGAAGVHRILDVCGSSWDVYVMPRKVTVLGVIQANSRLFLMALFVNIVFPFTLMGMVTHSFTSRLWQIDRFFSGETQEDGKLKTMPEPTGSDEITALMRNYNEMAERMNLMIEKQYVDKLREQEVNIARQRAELLALHNQINPHFLFNALESIRMHSVLKKEYETADMVEKLALMQRQNVEWGNETVRMEKEISFIKAYLELQKYRFGDKLRYEIQVDDLCLGHRIPKLALVTLVENACVHGVEEKAGQSWVFVRVTQNDENFTMEVEDTGNGMSEEKRRELQDMIDHVSIEMIQEHQRVGLLNAALRLSLLYEDQHRFEVWSEEGAGTIITVTVPNAVVDVLEFIV